MHGYLCALFRRGQRSFRRFRPFAHASGSKSRNFFRDPDLLVRRKLWIHWQGNYFSGDLFADPEVSCFVSQGFISPLTVQWNRIVNPGADAGLSQVRHEAFTIFGPNDIQVIDGARPGALIRRPDSGSGRR